MLLESAIASSPELRVRAAVRLPLRAARVVIPAGEAPAPPESLAHLVFELAPGPGHAQAEAIVLRLLVVADPVVGLVALGVRLFLVHDAAGGAVLVVRDAVRGEDARRHRLDLLHLVVLALEFQLLRLEERLQPGFEERLV